MIKNKTKNSPLLCCGTPNALDKQEAKLGSTKKVSKDHDFTNYLSFKTKEDLKMNSTSPSPKGDKSGRKKSKVKKAFSKIVKAVFFDTILMRKDNKSKVHRCDSTGSTEFMDDSKTSSNKSGRNLSKCDDSLLSASVSRSSQLNSNSSSLILSSTTTSARTSSVTSIFESDSSPRVVSDGKKPFRSFRSSRSNSFTNQGFKSGELKLVQNREPTTVSMTSLLMMILTLMVLVLYGRAFAVLFTSTWLVIIRRRQIGEIRKAGPAIQAEMQKEVTEFVVDRKKVIMDGFLQRNQSRINRV